MKIEVYDTTLRDGTQGEGINLSLGDKLRIAERLDALGVDYIEGGWPGSNPKDVAFFRAAANRTWRHARIHAFGSTRRPNVRPEDDANLQTLAESGTHGVTIFGKSWTHHVTEALQTTYEENLAMIAESVAYLRSRGLPVIYDAEHFFDGYRADAAYALATLRAAVEAGTSMLVLCDTNGGTLPDLVSEATRAVRERFDLPLGIHTHNDCELAVANTLAAIAAGATQVQGTFNGYGERCGNANLCSLIPTLELKLGHSCLPPGGLAHLTEMARFVSEIANRAMETGQPYVGQSAFAHKGGIHVSAMRRSPIAYQHIDPALVGNRQRTLICELSGRANVQELVARVGSAGLDPARASAVVEQVKELENQGFAFEGAEASVHLLVRRSDPGVRGPVRAGGLHGGDPATSLGRDDRRGDGQAAGGGRGDPHRRRRERAGQRPGSGGPQGAAPALPADRQDPPARLQGARARRARGHRIGGPRADRDGGRRGQLEHGGQLGEHYRGQLDRAER